MLQYFASILLTALLSVQPVFARDGVAGIPIDGDFKTATQFLLLGAPPCTLAVVTVVRSGPPDADGNRETSFEQPRPGTVGITSHVFPDGHTESTLGGISGFGQKGENIVNSYAGRGVDALKQLKNALDRAAGEAEVETSLFSQTDAPYTELTKDCGPIAKLIDDKIKELSGSDGDGLLDSDEVGGSSGDDILTVEIIEDKEFLSSNAGGDFFNGSVGIDVASSDNLYTFGTSNDSGKDLEDMIVTISGGQLASVPEGAIQISQTSFKLPTVSAGEDFEVDVFIERNPNNFAVDVQYFKDGWARRIQADIFGGGILAFFEGAFQALFSAGDVDESYFDNFQAYYDGGQDGGVGSGGGVFGGGGSGDGGGVGGVVPVSIKVGGGVENKQQGPTSLQDVIKGNTGGSTGSVGAPGGQFLPQGIGVGAPGTQFIGTGQNLQSVISGMQKNKK